MYHASDIHRLRPSGAPGEDTKPGRPYLLLHDTPAGGRLATFAYGTRQSSLLDGGGACVVVAASRRNGLSHPTYFCPCRLFAVPHRSIRERMGRLDPEDLARTREALRRSLGIGRGSNRGAAAGSWRGAFVRLDASTRVVTGAEFALVVTEPEYSRRRWFQHLVPFYDEGAEMETGDVEVEAPWVEALFPGMRRGYLGIQRIFSGSESGRPAQPGHFSQLTSIAADEGTLARVDAALCDLFQL